MQFFFPALFVSLRHGEFAHYCLNARCIIYHFNQLLSVKPTRPMNISNQ